MMNGIIMWRCGLIRKRFWTAASDLGIPSYLHVIFLQENHMKTLWKNSVWIPDFLQSKHIHVKYNNVAAESKTIGQCGLQNFLCLIAKLSRCWHQFRPSISRVWLFLGWPIVLLSAVIQENCQDQKEKLRHIIAMCDALLPMMMF